MLESLALHMGAQTSALTAASFPLAFLGGVIAGFGPCVLPMIPALFAYLTGHLPEAETADLQLATARSLGLATLFVLGLATTSAGIGVIAALVGHAVLIGRWAYWIVAGICLLMGLQLLEVISLRIWGLDRWVTHRPRAGGTAGAFLFGLLFGLVATPCATPVLAVIATLAAMSGDVIVGAGLLFVYGIGKGVPLLLVALFSGFVLGMKGFSRVTAWMSRVGGAVLIGLSAYLVWIA